MKYNEDAIDRLYEENLTEARRLLSTLRVVEGRRPSIGGLNGWVYEQTIRYCLLEELMERGQCPTIKEQVSLEGRVKIDLLVGHVAVEVKRALATTIGNIPRTEQGWREKGGCISI
jgi:hypothetical protein